MMSDPSPIFPPDCLSKWIHSVCVVTFDLELGQAMEEMHPATASLSEEEKSNVCYLAFPDSNSGCMGDTLFHFRIRHSCCCSRMSREFITQYNSECPVALQADNNFLFGYVFFRQLRDETIRRGYFQKSVVVLSKLPFINFFMHLVMIIAPSYFAHGIVGIESACSNIEKWSQPLPNSFLSLPILGSIIQIRVPCKDDRIIFPGSIPVKTALSTNEIADTIVPTVHEPELYRWLSPILFHLQILWELVLLNEPLVVIGSSPTICSNTVQSLINLIWPLHYATEYRPFFTIHDSEFKEFTTKTQAPPNVIIGVTNPFFFKTLSHWPHVIRMPDESPELLVPPTIISNSFSHDVFSMTHSRGSGDQKHRHSPSSSSFETNNNSNTNNSNDTDSFSSDTGSMTLTSSVTTTDSTTATRSASSTNLGDFGLMLTIPGNPLLQEGFHSKKQSKDKLRKSIAKKSTDSKTGVYTQWKAFLQRDKQLLKRLLKGGGSSPSASTSSHGASKLMKKVDIIALTSSSTSTSSSHDRQERPCQAQTAIIRRFFLELTQSFIIPLERYVSSLMPLHRDINPFRAPPILGQFDTESFIHSLSTSGPQLTSKIKGDWEGLYRKFIKSPNFAWWLDWRRKEVNLALEAMHFETLARTDLVAWSSHRHEVEIVDFILKITHKMDCCRRGEIPVGEKIIREVSQQILRLRESLSPDLQSLLVTSSVVTKFERNDATTNNIANIINTTAVVTGATPTVSS